MKIAVILIAMILALPALTYPEESVAKQSADFYNGLLKQRRQAAIQKGIYSGLDRASENLRLQRLVQQGKITAFEAEQIKIENRKAEELQRMSQQQSLTPRRRRQTSCITDWIGDTAFTDCD